MKRMKQGEMISQDVINQLKWLQRKLDKNRQNICNIQRREIKNNREGIYIFIKSINENVKKSKEIN